MTISYNWLSDYLPLQVAPERLSLILTAIGLEVEKMEAYEEVKGGLRGLLIGEVLEATQHPNADKLKVTRVRVGNEEPLQIVCGAPNVAAGQKVVVATVGTTIYPLAGEPVTMKVAKIRGTESRGMICAEDEIGLGTSHAGILVLPEDVPVGRPAAEYFKPYSDIIYEIGLTPNRMDAMSHWGVARDVCAYLSHHDGKALRPVLPATADAPATNTLPVQIEIKDAAACRRYAGVSIADINVLESPRWLQQRLKAIGLRPINNIVDITNYIQHETGQPLHAFDYDAIRGKKVVVQTLPEGTVFKTLDEKDRKLSAEDLMICNAEAGMCIAGVFGGWESGVTDATKHIFLESAWFDPGTIRKTSFRHGLRTDAATRFEKGIDISATVAVLKRAAAMIREVAGGTLASPFLDVYPDPQPKTVVTLTFAYLKKLSGKTYAPETAARILQSLGFDIRQQTAEALTLEVPYHKPDVSLPADVVEEILRIDGLDSIDIPAAITITPAVEANYRADALREKAAGYFTGLGFSEILTNSITNSRYTTGEEEGRTVKLMNNLSSELDILRPAMLYTALEVMAFNTARKQQNLRFFEFGKTYSTDGTGRYAEQNHLCLYLTGQLAEAGWKKAAPAADLYYLKGAAEALLQLAGFPAPQFESAGHAQLQPALDITLQGKKVGYLGQVAPQQAAAFDLKQPVYFADLDWDALVIGAADRQISYRPLPKYPAVERDLALVVPRNMQYEAIRQQLGKLRLDKLQSVKLFDVFQSEKLGAGKKSLAVNFTFLDEEKTLTDKEIDGWMQKIMTTLEKELEAEIRR